MIEGSFDAKKVESDISTLWEEKEAFKYRLESDKKAYTIILPPPNITGSLHVGHALCYTIQDILIRYKRMKGFNVLWQPGLDHAGIVTQLLVEKGLENRGIDAKSLTRDELIRHIWEWKDRSGSTILDQMHKLGCSIDLSMLRFTMDKKSSRAVIKTFVALYREGLIYKDTRLVNWDPKLKSAISDLEVVEKEQQGKMYYIKYALSSGGHVLVATTRPETLFGDTGVVVHPEDERYKHLIGTEAIVPICERRVKILGDLHSDPLKGSGVVKITPAHDFNDFEVGKRHGLEQINIFDDSACLNANVPEEFQGMDRYEARKAVIAHLEAAGLLDHVEDIKHTIPYGDRSGVVIEPYLTKQWFIDAKVLAKRAMEVVESGEVSFVPKNWENTYFEWMRNIRPWCISRQITWGHQIPAWYGPDDFIFVAETEEEANRMASEHYGHDVELRREQDVLDTWYSSSLWPFSTLGWPDEKESISQHYPNDVLITGFDIIFFWVSRMIMMGCHFNGKPPFKQVYIHALVRDRHGNKMSKSRGNVIDPLDLIDEFGADALRFSMAAFATPGRDVCIAKERINGYKGLFVKLWNCVKFAQLNKCFEEKEFAGSKISYVNQWIVLSLYRLIGDIENSITEYRFDEYANKLYHFLWDDFCGWYLEFSKVLFRSEDEALVKETRTTFAYVIKHFLLLLSPISPFVSEYINRECYGDGILMKSLIPDFSAEQIDKSAERKVSFIQGVISEIRSIRKELNIPFSIKIKFDIDHPIDETGAALISSMAKVEYSPKTQGNIHFVAEGCNVTLAAQDFDINAQRNRLLVELEKINQAIASANKSLTDEQFLAKASPNVIADMKQRAEDMLSRKQKIEGILR